MTDKWRAPRRGIPWARVPEHIDRVLIIRLRVIVTRTSEVNQYGSPIWVCSGGKKYGYGGSVHVKPVYKYSDIFGATT